MSYRTLPRVTFTTPNIASVGITETEARQAGIECECRSIPLHLVPRALVNRDTRGLVKIVAESKTGVVRGVHMPAPNAGDAILSGVYAIECGLTVKQVAHLVSVPDHLRRHQAGRTGVHDGSREAVLLRGMIPSISSCQARPAPP